MDYDALNSESEDEYFAFVHWLEERTADELRQAKEDDLAMKTVIQRYLDTGYSAHLSSGELTDFFCVSTPCILHKAGLSEGEDGGGFDVAVKIYDSLNAKTFPRYFPQSE